MNKFDAIVIGAGQAGVPLAKKLAAAGWKTALIEKRAIGGTCINDGCTPTKTMIASARMAYMAGRSDELGIHIPEYRVDFKAIMDRKSTIVKQFREGATKGLEETKNLTVIYGTARFVDPHTLYVDKNDGSFENYTAKKIFINTGCTPFIPDIDGLKEIPYLTSTTLLEIKEVPEHLLIIGAGYIGLEFAQLFRRLGSQVTIVEKSNRLMPKEDDDICTVMSDIFDQDGIRVWTETQVESLSLKLGKVHVKLDGGGKGPASLNCSHVLVASGRTPQTAALGLENTGVVCDEKGFIKVNKRLQTAEQHIYALGDVKGGPAFTHISYNDHLVITENLLNGRHKDISKRMIPYCMFTDPQLGRVGMNESQAKEAGIDYLVASIPMKNVARAIESAETRGLMKAIIDKKSRRILGAAIIGEQGGEIMTVLQMAMMGKITADEIRSGIFAHPLYSESLNNLFMSV
ncbi:mercuric reductase [Pedobacter antarcticus 4BY]|uniref:Mercuric reductase n=2 Tax=Pedobacter antarcticus TaxID=34086 RepID=A0A081PDG4_9SPHI|nr:mercuric reductase [Pedobacter antarcticus]KEQ28737.1 mercuric reductase [Pedobacter antarcticus 4BY]SFE40231.1 dihydrolipoamide dehydrogenase [Pedobacter antarcticus]